MKFRKKPVVIEAIQFLYERDRISELTGFCGPCISAVGLINESGEHTAQIRTLEDGDDSYRVKHIATEGDWIIKGVQGEFYPCKPDIFESTYERVEDDAS